MPSDRAGQNVGLKTGTVVYYTVYVHIYSTIYTTLEKEGLMEWQVLESACVTAFVYFHIQMIRLSYEQCQKGVLIAFVWDFKTIILGWPDSQNKQ